jgi:hypothetical protein
LAIVPIPEKPILPVAPKLDDQLASKFNSDMVRLLYDILTKIARRANASVWIDPGDDQTADRLVAFVGQANKVKSTGTTAADLAAFMTALAEVVSASPGLIAKTGTTTYRGRTLTGTANQIVVTNGSGVGGDPTVSLPSSVILTAPAGAPTAVTANLSFFTQDNVRAGDLGIYGSLSSNAVSLVSRLAPLHLEGLNKNIELYTGTGYVELHNGQMKWPSVANLSTDPHMLDDYEEGTWTPSYVPYTGPGFSSITYGIRSGIYTKIGNMVYVACKIYTSSISIGSATGPVTITGFPFAVPFMLSRVYAFGWSGVLPYGFADVIRDVSVSNMGTGSVDNGFYAFGQSGI